MCSRLPRRRFRTDTGSRLSIGRVIVSASGMKPNRKTGRASRLTGVSLHVSVSTSCAILPTSGWRISRAHNVRVTTAVDPTFVPSGRPTDAILPTCRETCPSEREKGSSVSPRADGTGVVRTFPCPGQGDREPTDWTSRRGPPVVNVLGPRDADVWIVPRRRTDRPRSRFSPKRSPSATRDRSRDGRWVAYASDESGRPEVSVRRVSGPPKRIPTRRRR